MNENLIDIVYDLLSDSRIPQPGDPLVENLFDAGSECAQLYTRVYDANRRLCERLGVEEDADVEILVNSLLKICELTGKRMYQYGAAFQKTLV